MRLADPTLVLAFGERVLLSHGDALCLGDIGYQRYRAVVRAPACSGRLPPCLSPSDARSATPCARRGGRRRAGSEASSSTSTRRPRWHGPAAAGPPRCSRPHPRTGEPCARRPASFATSSATGTSTKGAAPRRGPALAGERLLAHRARDGLGRVAPFAGVKPGGSAGAARARPRAPRRSPTASGSARSRVFRSSPRAAQTTSRTLREMATLFLAEKEFSGARRPRDRSTTWPSRSLRRPACRRWTRLRVARRLRRHRRPRRRGARAARDRGRRRRRPRLRRGTRRRGDERRAGDARLARGRRRRPVGDGRLQRRDARVRARHRHARRHHRHPEQADTRTERGRWLRALAAEYEDFAARIDEGEETFLDPYAAESLEEFFAVGAEVFFVAPDELEAELPRAYALLQSFFRQDPARAEAGRSPLSSASALRPWPARLSACRSCASAGCRAAACRRHRRPP